MTYLDKRMDEIAQSHTPGPDWPYSFSIDYETESNGKWYATNDYYEAWGTFCVVDYELEIQYESEIPDNLSEEEIADKILWGEEN